MLKANLKACASLPYVKRGRDELLRLHTSHHQTGQVNTAAASNERALQENREKQSKEGLLPQGISPSHCNASKENIAIPAQHSGPCP